MIKHRESKRQILLLFLLILTGTISAQQKGLDYYLSKALQNSPLLKDYQNQINAGQIDIQREKAGNGLQVAGISNNLYAPVIKGIGYDNAITNGANVSALLTVSKEITGKNNRENRYKSIELQNQSISNSGKISEQELKKNVSNLYISAFGDLLQFKFNSEMLDLMVKEESVLKKIAENGGIRQTEYLSFVVNLQQQSLLLEKIRNQYQNSFAQLNYVCGIEDTTFTSLPDPDLRVENKPELFGSIFHHQFEIDSLKLANSDQQIDFSYQPKISIFADGGYNSSLAYQPEKNFGISAGFSLRIPIYDGGQRKMLHNQLKFSELTRQNYHEFYTAQFNQQTQQLQQQLLEKQKLDEKITKQITLSKILMDANYKLLETGDVTISDYILSLGNYLSAKNMLLENRIEKYLIINELNYWNRTK